ncbi:FtsX-like permease family protein [Pleurocapsales cyanobacterium LEGE 10410]|nr:FtsX-like permease family protein [Pleurocapsales cyanobacterium LEGE 10410]
MILSIPLAWLQLVHRKIKFIATIAGIAFVVVLLFMQLGFQDALFESAVRVHQVLEGDLFLTSSQYKALTSQQSFPRTRLYQTLAFEGIESVSPLYFQFGKLKNILDGQKYSIFVLGVDPSKLNFSLEEIERNINKLKLPDTALFDLSSRPEFGPIAQKFTTDNDTKIEISPFNQITKAKKFTIEGLFSIGPSFGIDGNLITNYSSFLQAFPDRNIENIDLGLITLEPYRDPEKIRDYLVASLPEDVNVLTFDEFVQLEKSYWDLRTPIGFVFKIMVFMGFIVGIGITYQILYSNISNHLVAYATLKAIGFTNRYLLTAVFQQALLLALLGFVPGIIVSLGLYDLAKNVTHLPVIMDLEKGLVVFLSIISMCSISGFMAVQKLRSVDPADIF